jgi:hypothetical protein
MNLFELLPAIQEDIGARLEADEFFTHIAVLVQRKGVTESEIETALNVLNAASGKVGACAIVLMPTLSAPNANVPGPQFQIDFIVRVLENPTLNRDAGGTNKSAEEIALRVLHLLHHFTALGRVGTLYAAKNAATPFAELDGIVGYDCQLSTMAGLPFADKVQTPGIAVAGVLPDVSVTITCGTAGASVFYTLDESYPRNPGATLYTAPFSLAAAATIRAAAYLDGKISSDVQQTAVT